MKTLLQDKSLRVTAFRLAVLEIFEKNTNAINISQIEKELGDFDRITLYRTIKLFLQKGIIHEISIAGDVKKYGLCSHHCADESHTHDHIHFFCTACNETFCLDMAEMPEVKHPSFQIQSIDIQTKGICENCR